MVSVEREIFVFAAVRSSAGKPSASPQRITISRRPESRWVPSHLANCCDVNCLPAASRATSAAWESSFCLRQADGVAEFGDLDLGVMLDAANVIFQ